MTIELHRSVFLPEPFNNDINVHSFPKQRRIELSIHTHINPVLIAILKSKGISIMLAELFYSAPYLESVIHSDTFGNDISKINWIYQGRGSKMNWFRPILETNVISGNLRNTYKKYEESEVELIHSEEIHSPSLIQAAIPHNIVNGYEERWAISLMLRDNSKFGQLKFNNAIKYLSELCMN
jgi:hypothetical protein